MVLVEKTRGGRVYVRLVGEEFVTGDRADVSNDVAEYLVEERGDFEYVDDVTDVEYEEVDEDEELETDGTLPFNPGNNTVDEVEEKVEDVDDPGAVQALLNLEEEQENRSTAKDALEDRLDELEG